MISHHNDSFDRYHYKRESTIDRISIDNIKMKLDLSLAAIISTHTVELCQNGVKENCFLSELTEPDHFAKWDCSAPVTLGYVPYII